MKLGAFQRKVVALPSWFGLVCKKSNQSRSLPDEWDTLRVDSSHGRNQPRLCPIRHAWLCQILHIHVHVYCSINICTKFHWNMSNATLVYSQQAWSTAIQVWGSFTKQITLKCMTVQSTCICYHFGQLVWQKENGPIKCTDCADHCLDNVWVYHTKTHGFGIHWWVKRYRVLVCSSFCSPYWNAVTHDRDSEIKSVQHIWSLAMLYGDSAI